MDTPNGKSVGCAHDSHDHCEGYTYPYGTYRCACHCHEARWSIGQVSTHNLAILREVD